MLHETFGDSGPLVVQLLFQPRFIIRFSELQSALEQSTIGRDGEEAEVHGMFSAGHAYSCILTAIFHDLDYEEVAESLEALPTEHLELQEQHDDPAEQDVQPVIEQEYNPSVDGVDEHHLDATEDSASNVADSTQPTQEDHAEESADAYDHQDVQPAANDRTESIEQAQEEEVEEVVVTVKTDIPEPNDGHEDRDGASNASESQDDNEDHAEEEGDLVDYVEEFEEGEEHYEEDYEDSDSTETPGGDHEYAEMAEAVDEGSTGEYEVHVEEASPVEEQAVLSSPLADSQGTDNGEQVAMHLRTAANAVVLDGLANDVDAGPDVVEDVPPSEPTDPQQDVGHGDEQELGHDEQTEPGAEGDSAHGASLFRTR